MCIIEKEVVQRTHQRRHCELRKSGVWWTSGTCPDVQRVLDTPQHIYTFHTYTQ